MVSLITFLVIGPWQIAVVVVLVLLLFGGKKIPELMRGLGSGIKEFKDASKEDDQLEEKNFLIDKRRHHWRLFLWDMKRLYLYIIPIVLFIYSLFYWPNRQFEITLQAIL